MAEQEKRTSPLGKLVDKAGNVVGKAADAIGVKDFYQQGLEKPPIDIKGNIKPVPGVIDKDPQDFGPESVEFPTLDSKAMKEGDLKTPTVIPDPLLVEQIKEEKKQPTIKERLKKDVETVKKLPEKLKEPFVSPKEKEVDIFDESVAKKGPTGLKKISMEELRKLAAEDEKKKEIRQEQKDIELTEQLRTDLFKVKKDKRIPDAPRYGNDIVKGYNLIPIDDIGTDDPDATGDFMYYPFEGQFGYTIKDRTIKGAQQMAAEIYNYMRTTGSSYYTPAIEELNSYHRLMLEARGNPELLAKVGRRERASDYVRLSSYLEDHPKFGKLSQETRDKMTSFAVNTKYGAHAIPSIFHTFVGEGVGVIDELLGILPLYDGLLTDFYAAGMDKLQGDNSVVDKMARESGAEPEDILFFDDNPFWNKTKEVVQLSNNSPKIRITGDEYRNTKELREDPDFLTGAIRQFSGDFALSLSVIGGLGIKAVNYSNALSVQARKNLIANGSKVTKDSIYGEMRRMHKRTYEKAKEETGFKINRYLKKYYQDAELEYAYNKGKFLTEVAVTEAGITAAMQGIEVSWEEWLKPTLELTGYDAIDKSLYGIVGATAAGMGSQFAVSRGSGLLVEGSKRLARGVNNLYKFGLDLPGVAQTIKPVVRAMNLGPEHIREVLQSTDPILNLDVNPEMRKRIRAMLNQHLKLWEKHPDSAQIMITAANRNMKLIEDFEKLGLGDDKVDKIYMTLGMMFEHDVMRAAEIATLRNATEGEVIKMDKNFSFIEKAHAITARRENLSIALNTALADLGEVQLPVQSDINKLKMIFQLEKTKLDAENAQLDNLLSNAVMYQVLPILEDFEFDEVPAMKLMEILDQNPHLKLSKKELKAVDTAQRVSKHSKQQAVIVDEARKRVRDRLVEIRGIDNKNPITYKVGTGKESAEEVGILATDNVEAAGRIISYVGNVSRTTLENVQDGVRWTYQKGYTDVYDKLNNLPEDLTNVNVTDALININKKARAGILGDAQSYLGRVNLVIEPSVDKLLEKNLKILARALNDKLEADGKNAMYDSKTVKKLLDNKIAEDPDMATRLGKITNIDRVEILSKMENLNLNLNLDIETFNDIRQFTNLAARSAYNTDKNRYATIDEISNSLDRTFDNHVQTVAKRGEGLRIGPPVEGASKIPEKNQLTIAAEELEKAERDYRERYLNRGRMPEGSLFEELGDFTQRSTPAGKKDSTKSKAEQLDEQIKTAFTFKDTDTAVPTPAVISQRIRAKTQQKDFFDDLFNKYNDGDLLFKKIVNTFGEPQIVEGELTYVIPKETDELYKPFMFFMEQLNTYVSARTAKEFDKLERSGEIVAWNRKVDEIITNDTSLENILENVRRSDIPPALMKEGGRGKPFYETLSVLNKALSANSNGTIEVLGGAMYKDIYALARKNKAVRDEVIKVQKRLKNVIMEKAPEVAKERGRVQSIIGIAEVINKNALAPNNAEDFVEMLIKDVMIDEKGQVSSTGIDQLIKVAKKTMEPEEVDRTISRIIGVGIMNKFTVGLDKTSWDHIDKVKDLKTDGFMKRKDNNPLFRALQGEKEILMKNFNENKSYRMMREKAVDGLSLVEFMQNNRPLLVKYLRNGDEETFKKIEVIANLSVKARDPNIDIALRDATHGMTKFAFNTAMSRIAAVYSGRASVRYPMIEMSFALLQKKEAESVAALLTANKEFVDLVYDTMLKGKVDLNKFKPKVIENYAIDALQMVSTHAQAFVENAMNSSDEELSVHAFLNIIDIDKQAQGKFPFLGEKHKMVGGDEIFGIGGAEETEEYKEIKDKRKSYKRYVAQNMKALIEETENPVLMEVYQSVINNQESPFFQQ